MRRFIDVSPLGQKTKTADAVQRPPLTHNDKEDCANTM
jgi:hypothetical protein